MATGLTPTGYTEHRTLHYSHLMMPAGLWERLTRSFGYLTTVGYTSASSGVNKKFTVVIGETGSAFTNSGDLKVRWSGERDAQQEIICLVWTPAVRTRVSFPSPDMMRSPH